MKKLICLILVVSMVSIASATEDRVYLYESQTDLTTPDSSGNNVTGTLLGPEGIIADTGGVTPHNGRVKMAENVLDVVPWGGMTATYDGFTGANDTTALWFKCTSPYDPATNGPTGASYNGALFRCNGTYDLQVGGQTWMPHPDNPANWTLSDKMDDGYVQSFSYTGYNSWVITDPDHYNAYRTDVVDESTDPNNPFLYVYDDGEWHHLVRTFSVYDGTMVNPATEIYVDGLRVVSGVSPGASPSGDVLKVGQAIDYAGYFDGQIDNVRCYSHELTPAEVWALYVSETDPADFPVNPNPANAEEDVSPGLSTLSWEEPPYIDPNMATLSYTVYFDDDDDLSDVTGIPSAGTSIACPVSPLVLGVPYHWRVDVDITYTPASGKPGETLPGRPWSFTVIAPEVTLVSPSPNGVIDVPVTEILEWAGDGSEDSFNVLFGSSLGSMTEVLTATNDTTYDPDLEWASPYFWRVDVNVDGYTVEGDPWSFTTIVPVCDEESVPGDTDGDCDVDMDDFADLASSWLICGLTPVEACD